MTTLDATTVEALGWALVHFAWQGARPPACSRCSAWPLHGAGARVRYALAAFTLAAMALLPPPTGWPRARLEGGKPVAAFAGRRPASR